MTRKRTKVLHIVPRFYPGGAERLAFEYVTRLDSKRFDTYIASCVEDGPLRQEFDIDKKHIFIGSRKKHGGRIGVAKKLKKYVARVKPDIIHTHLLGADGFGYLCKKKSGRSSKWVSTQHNVEHKTPAWRRFLWKRMLRRVDVAIPVSSAVEQYVSNKFKVPREKIITIPNGIALEPWTDIPYTQLFSQKAAQFATIGRLEEQKGHTYLLKALSHLSDLDWHLHVFGDGAQEHALQQEAHKLGLMRRISWHGAVDTISEDIVQIDLVIQPSLWEGRSLVVMEAMAAARGVLVSSAAGADLVEHNKSGLVVPTRDVAALTNMIRFAIAHKDALRKMAGAARRHAKKYFDIQDNISAVEDIYASLV